jgi:hypothetical protein
MASPPRPTDFPFIDLLETNQIDWRLSPKRFTGMQAGTPVKSDENNTLFFLNSMWGVYADYGQPHLVDFTDTTTTTRLSTTKLDYNVGDDIKTGAGAVPTSTPVYFLNGCRIDVDEALLSAASAWPLLLPDLAYPRRVWIYLDANLSYPSQPAALIRVEDVAPATAATPGANEIAIAGVDTDANGLITAVVYPAVEPEYQFIFAGPVFTFTTDVTHSADVTCSSGLAVEGTINAFSQSGTLLVNGTALIAGDTTIAGQLDMDGNPIANVSTLDTTGNVSIGGDLDMDGGAISNVTTLTASSTGASIDATSSAAANAAVLAVNSSTGPGLRGVSTGGPGVRAESASASAAVIGINSGSGPGLSGTGGSASAGVSGTASAAAQPGVFGTGFNGAASHGVVGTATNTSSYGVQGNAAASATTSGAGVRADGTGDAPGLWSVATNGHAALLTSDTSSPTRAVLRITPQDSDPSTTGVGDVLINSSRLNMIRHHDGSIYRSVHSSAAGFVFGFSTIATGSNINTSGNICAVTITPETTGTVIVTVTGWWSGGADATNMAVILKDTTAPATIVTTQLFVAQATAGAARWKPFTVRYPYTLPSAATRSFAVELDVSALTNWEGVFLTVEGVF